MTDGGASYPTEQIQSLKVQIKSLKQRSFKFYGLGFMCHNNNVEKMAQEFGGETTFAKDAIELKRNYCEIFTKSLL